MKKEKIDLNNPIFVLYVNVEGFGRARAESYIAEMTKKFDYENAKFWIIPSNVTKIECIYDGKSKNRSNEISNLIEEINEKIDILSNSNNFDDFKINIRDWRLSKIIN